MRSMSASDPADCGLLVDDDDYDSSSTSGELPRKRMRLNFLSPEEKLVRRKLKNRVAAQTARDRKKQRMTELEEELAAAQARNEALAAENHNLRLSADSLLQENSLLKQRLQSCAPVGDDMDDVTRKPSDACDLKSAALLVVPQQQDTQARTVFQLAAFCITLLAFISLVHGLKRNQRQHHQMTMMSCNQVLFSTGLPWNKESMRPPREWWGRDHALGLLVT